MNRRQFLSQTTLATIAAATAPSIVPSSVLGANGPSPSNRINVGAIGTGARGRDVLSHFTSRKDCRVIALADVNMNALSAAKKLIDDKYQSEDCETHHDFRELLRRKDIDAVMIASTDNWHVLHALAAVRAGKDVYLEKPMGLTLAEDQALRQEVTKRKRVFQFGTQQRSDRKFRIACELVRNGYIGKLRNVNVWAPASIPGGSTTKVAPPVHVDYEFWLGPAPYREHTEKLTTNDTWWFVSDFAVGFIAGWGIHPIDIALWGAGDLMQGFMSVHGTGEYAKGGSHDTAIDWDVNYTFENGLTMRFVGAPNGSGNPFKAGEEWRKKYGPIDTHGTAFEGDKGWVHVDRSRIQVSPTNLIDIDPGEFKTKLAYSSDHVQNFLDSIKSRKPTVCPIDEAVLADAFCHVPDIALRLNRKVTYNVKRETFVNDEEANKRLALRNMRKPWHV